MALDNEAFQKKIEEAFHEYDTDKSGFLEMGELTRVLRDVYKEMGEMKTPTE